MDKLPNGWVKRRSGVVVPGGRWRLRRAHAVAGLILALVAVASPVAHAISAWSRAALDVVTLIRAETDDPGTDPGEPACGSPRG